MVTQSQQSHIHQPHHLSSEGHIHHGPRTDISICPENNFVNDGQCFLCPENTYSKEIHNYYDGNTTCNDRIYNTCNEFINSGSNSETSICGINTIDYFLKHLDFPINIPIELSVNEEDIHGFCCSLRCKDYWKLLNNSCPYEYKKKENSGDDYTINDSGIYTPLQKCCEKNTCKDWENDGNLCPENRIAYEEKIRPGYSADKCCYSTCEEWKKLYPNICHLNKIIPGKIGWGSDECCEQKENICLFKSFECPENTELKEENFRKECDRSTCESDLCYCPDTQGNKDICCTGNNKCRSFICPNNYSLNEGKLNKPCINETCSEVDIEQCCQKNANCNTMECPSNYLKKGNNEYCSSTLCSEKDNNICCEKQKTCEDMICPDTYFKNVTNKDKLCFKQSCDHNKLNIQRCCKDCEHDGHSKKYECDEEGNSYATECDSNYLLVDGTCIKIEKDNINIILSFEGDYNTLIKDDKSLKLLFLSIIAGFSLFFTPTLSSFI